MATKFLRRKCATCKKKRVVWKMIVFTNEAGANKIVFCWHCAQRLYNKLTALNIEYPPDKKRRTQGAFILPPKPQREAPPIFKNGKWQGG